MPASSDAGVGGPTPHSRTEDAVLLTTGHSAGYPCLRSLAPRDIYTIVASPDESAPEFVSRFCDQPVVVPDPEEDVLAYRDALLDLASRPGVRTIIPTDEHDAYVLSRYRERFEEYVDLVVPDVDRLRSVHDRLELFEIADDAGVPIPETQLLTDVDDWRPRHIVKSRYNLLADAYCPEYDPSQTVSVNTIKHLEPGEEPDVAAIREEMKHTPIIQEFVPSAGEYMVNALYDNGEPVAVCQQRQVRCSSYVGGGGVYRESVDIPELESAARTLLDALDYHGLACIEYMEDATTGEFKLLEINPRMWQSLASTVRTGADFPYYYWLTATDSPDVIDPSYDLGVGTHMLEGELSYLLSLFRDSSPHVERPSLPAAISDVVWSCLTDPEFDYLKLDDPLPFVRSALRILPHRR
ncbi:ATP-grasp domain-containing protein [Salinibaculum salinum]|uniref:carboxylate--amine ligase n=1 Tax=Salinibaculum salinum TaxID=3131996 RepID=UPI0030ECCD84